MEMSCLEEISFSLYTLFVNWEQPHNYWLEVQAESLGRNIDLARLQMTAAPLHWLQEAPRRFLPPSLREKVNK